MGWSLSLDGYVTNVYIYGTMNTNQVSFNVKKEIVRKDENKKWEKLKYDLRDLQKRFKAGTIINDINNEALIDKILKRMERYEKRES